MPRKDTMSYLVTVNKKQTYHVDRAANGQENRIIFEGETLSLDWRQIAPLIADVQGNMSTGGHYSLLLNGKSYDIFARCITRPDQKDSQTYELQIAGQRFEVLVEDERTRLFAGLVRRGAHTNEVAVHAPMPGLVVAVPVELGATITAGQTVVILEAMKMENDLSSPISGTVKELRVSRGQTVDHGEVLVVITGN
jgi:biotin carboxyl carrier protein